MQKEHLHLANFEIFSISLFMALAAATEFFKESIYKTVACSVAPKVIIDCESVLRSVWDFWNTIRLLAVWMF